MNMQVFTAHTSKHLEARLTEDQQSKPIHAQTLPLPEGDTPEAKKLREVARTEFKNRDDCQVTPIKWSDGVCGFILWAGDMLTDADIAECYRVMRSRTEELLLDMTYQIH